MSDKCENCGENLGMPGLYEAFTGTSKCSECEHLNPVDEGERKEIFESVDQDIHIIKQYLAL